MSSVAEGLTLLIIRSRRFWDPFVCTLMYQHNKSQVYFFVIVEPEGSVYPGKLPS